MRSVPQGFCYCLHVTAMCAVCHRVSVIVSHQHQDVNEGGVSTRVHCAFKKFARKVCEGIDNSYMYILHVSMAKVPC